MRIILGINRVLMAVGAIAATAMMLIVIADVISSFLFGRQIQNSFEIVAFYLMVALVFLPMGSAELSHEHINTDLVVQTVPTFMRTGLYVISQVLGAAFIALLCYQTAVDALRSYVRNEMVMGTTMMVTWPSRFFLPVGFGFLCLCLLANAATALLKESGATTRSGEK